MPRHACHYLYQVSFLPTLRMLHAAKNYVDKYRRWSMSLKNKEEKKEYINKNAYKKQTFYKNFCLNICVLTNTKPNICWNNPRFLSLTEAHNPIFSFYQFVKNIKIKYLQPKLENCEVYHSFLYWNYFFSMKNKTYSQKLSEKKKKN